MSKEKKIQEYERKQLIDELSKMPPMVIATAYLHALNYTRYGVDVTEKWLTATQNACALDRAYHQGYSDGLKSCAEREDVLDKIRAEVERRKKNSGGDPSRDLAFNVCLQIIDKYREGGGEDDE